MTSLTSASGTRDTTFVLNGTETTLTVRPRTLLSDALRHDAGVHGTHVGCEQGACGACTVIVDNVARRSCLTLTPQVDGCTVETIESVATSLGDRSIGLDPIQQAIHDAHGMQCGFCTPGIVMSLVAARRAGVDRAVAIDDVLDGHLCRCTGYVNLRAAIEIAWNDLEPRSLEPNKLEPGP